MPLLKEHSSLSEINQTGFTLLKLLLIFFGPSAIWEQPFRLSEQDVFEKIKECLNNSILKIWCSEISLACLNSNQSREVIIPI